jgi:hypothetical protein
VRKKNNKKIKLYFINKWGKNANIKKMEKNNGKNNGKNDRQKSRNLVWKTETFPRK